MSTNVAEPTLGTDHRLDDGDDNVVAHYANKAKIAEALVTGKPVRALCGKVFVPTRDPDGRPVCPRCEALRHQRTNRFLN